jgi:hypothetical protein
MSTVILCGMPEEREVLTAALPLLKVMCGTDKLNLPALVPPDCHRIVSMGLCGGLMPGLAVGDVALATEVVDEASQPQATDAAWNARVTTAAGNRHMAVRPCRWYSSGILDQADNREQRAILWKRYGAGAIDDETRYAAAFAAQRGIAFNVLRPLSDDYSETLPLSATGAIMNRDGSADVGYLLWSLGQQQTPSSASLFKVALDFKKSLDALEMIAAAAEEAISS